MKEQKSKSQKSEIPVLEVVENEVVNILDEFTLLDAESDINISELAQHAYKFSETVMRDIKEAEKKGNLTLAQKYIKPEQFKEFNDTLETVLNLVKKYNIEGEIIKNSDEKTISEIQAVIKHYVSKLSRSYNGILYNVVLNNDEFVYLQTTIKNHIAITGDDMIKLGRTSDLLLDLTYSSKTVSESNLIVLNVTQAISLYTLLSKHTMTGVTKNFKSFRNIMLVMEDIYKLYTSLSSLGNIAKEQCDVWISAVSGIQFTEKK